jgi:hypothetical protein
MAGSSWRYLPGNSWQQVWANVWQVGDHPTASS